MQIDPDEYATQVEVDTLKLFSHIEENLKYLPTMKEYNPVTFDAPAYFSIDYTNESSESSATLWAMTKHFIEMEQLINRNYVIKPEKPDQTEFVENNKNQ